MQTLDSLDVTSFGSTFQRHSPRKGLEKIAASVDCCKSGHVRADTKERGPDDETSMEPISERILQPERHWLCNHLAITSSTRNMC